MEPKRSFRDRMREIITAYGPTAASLTQLGLYWWYTLRHGAAG